MPPASSIAAMFAQRVIIGVGELAVSNQPQVTLSTYALGSCVGIAAYDPMTRAAGILHLMLPDSHLSPERAAAKPAMFLDTGFPMFLRGLAGLKGEPRRLKLFLAGGASARGLRFGHHGPGVHILHRRGPGPLDDEPLAAFNRGLHGPPGRAYPGVEAVLG